MLFFFKKKRKQDIHKVKTHKEGPRKAWGMTAWFPVVLLLRHGAQCCCYVLWSAQGAFSALRLLPLQRICWQKEYWSRLFWGLVFLTDRSTPFPPFLCCRCAAWLSCLYRQFCWCSAETTPPPPPPPRVRCCIDGASTRTGPEHTVCGSHFMPHVWKTKRRTYMKSVKADHHLQDKYQTDKANVPRQKTKQYHTQNKCFSARTLKQLKLCCVTISGAKGQRRRDRKYIPTRHTMGDR